MYLRRMISGYKGRLKASALVVTMMILGIILITALSISLVSLRERKASLGSNDSNQAFYTAQSGVESVLQQIANNSTGTVSNIDSDCSGTISSSGYSVKLLDSSGNVVSGCSTPVSNIAKLKSVGTEGQYQRAIEVAVANGNCTIDYTNDNIYIVPGVTQCSTSFPALPAMYVTVNGVSKKVSACPSGQMMIGEEGNGCGNGNETVYAICAPLICK